MALKREKVLELLRKKYTHTCKNCGKIFVFEHSSEKYCSDRCFQIYRSAGKSREFKIKKTISVARYGASNKQATFHESFDYLLARADANINDYSRADEMCIDFGIQDILDTIEREGVLQGSIPYLEKRQDITAPLVALDWAADNRTDPELIEHLKTEIQWLDDLHRGDLDAWKASQKLAQVSRTKTTR